MIFSILKIEDFSSKILHKTLNYQLELLDELKERKEKDHIPH